MPSASFTATEAREKLPALLTRAEKGENSLIIRNSKEIAAIVPAEYAHLAPIVLAVMKEVSDTLEMSNDPDVVEAFRRGQAELERGEIVWEDF
jgi:prevent-host-death family protein